MHSAFWFEKKLLCLYVQILAIFPLHIIAAFKNYQKAIVYAALDYLLFSLYVKYCESCKVESSTAEEDVISKSHPLPIPPTPNGVNFAVFSLKNSGDDLLSGYLITKKRHLTLHLDVKVTEGNFCTSPMSQNHRIC